MSRIRRRLGEVCVVWRNEQWRHQQQQDGIYALGKAHNYMLSILTVSQNWVSPNVAFETVSMFV